MGYEINKNTNSVVSERGMPQSSPMQHEDMIFSIKAIILTKIF